jgi:uncharacterized membrane protein HdeD (DUF308 family)
MTPNIQRNGRIARAVSGVLCLVAGVVVVWAGWPAAAIVRWIVAVALAAAGGFQLFEARRGWCVMRACGFRTPM